MGQQINFSTQIYNMFLDLQSTLHYLLVIEDAAIGAEGPVTLDLLTYEHFKDINIEDGTGKINRKVIFCVYNVLQTD